MSEPEPNKPQPDLPPVRPSLCLNLLDGTHFQLNPRWVESPEGQASLARVAAHETRLGEMLSSLPSPDPSTSPCPEVTEKLRNGFVKLN